MAHEYSSNSYVQSSWTPYSEWDYTHSMGNSTWNNTSISPESTESVWPPCAVSNRMSYFPPMAECGGFHQNQDLHYYDVKPVAPSTATLDSSNESSGPVLDASSCRLTLQKDETSDPKETMTTVKRKAAPSMGRKERRRTISLNSAFSALRSRIPKVPADTKLSKIKTLRLAALYIQHLNQILSTPQDGSQLQPSDFEVDLRQFRRSRVSGRSSFI